MVSGFSSGKKERIKIILNCVTAGFSASFTFKNSVLHLPSQFNRYFDMKMAIFIWFLTYVANKQIWLIILYVCIYFCIADMKKKSTELQDWPTLPSCSPLLSPPESSARTWTGPECFSAESEIIFSFTFLMVMWKMEIFSSAHRFQSIWKVAYCNVIFLILSIINYDALWENCP